jgi:hypothetical protein
VIYRTCSDEGDYYRWQCDSCGWWVSEDDRPEDGSSTCMVCAEDAEDEEQEEEIEEEGEF